MDPIDFTTGAYIDVYDGNINTLRNMRAEHPNKYQVMMKDIYAQVRCVVDSFDYSQDLSYIVSSTMDKATTVPIANIPMEELDG
jgi:hypothetical protein